MASLTSAEELTLAAMARRQWVDDVTAAFRALPDEGSLIRVNTGGDRPDSPFPRDRYSYTQHRLNKGGNENHFQGFQRLLSGHHFVISGGEWKARSSHLFVGRIVSRAGLPTLGPNSLDSTAPAGDTIVARLDVDAIMWHAGGVSLCGHVLAVPVECGPNWTYGVRGVDPPPCDPARSAIYFIDLREPTAPRPLSVSVKRERRKATAAGLLHIPDVGYLLGVLSAHKPEKGFLNYRIEFYWTVRADLCGGFSSPVVYRVPETLKWDSYQTINLVRETGGTVFMFGMTRKRVELFELAMPERGRPWVPALNWVDGREFILDKDFAAFEAGAGIFTRDGYMGLYSVPHWRNPKGQLGMTEWMNPRMGI